MVSTADEVRAIIEYDNPEALFADGFDDAIVGVARRCGQPTLVVYDYERGVDVLMKRDGMTYEEAVEWMEFNVVGTWIGEHTPIWLVRPPDSG